MSPVGTRLVSLALARALVMIELGDISIGPGEIRMREVDCSGRRKGEVRERRRLRQLQEEWAA